MLAFSSEIPIIPGMGIIQRFVKSLPLDKVPWNRMILIGAGVLFILWLIFTPSGLLGKADAVGYAVCHRIDARSFHLGERQIPLCARCSGQYLGAVLGIAFQLIVGKRRGGRPSWGIIAVLAGFVLVYAVDGLNSYLHLIPDMSRYYIYEPSNTLRLLSGTGLGLAVSIGLMPAFHQTVWKKWSSRPAIDGMKEFIILLLLAGFMDFLVLTENSLILYPLALISAAGVFLLLTIVYTMIWLLVFKMENRYERPRQLVYSLSAGFIAALAQIAILDFVRYLVTGTWDGFHIG